jgi:hypothetical protein
MRGIWFIRFRSSRFSEKIQYYEQLQNVMEQRPDLKIMRIVRATPATSKWIRSMVEEFHGRFQWEHGRVLIEAGKLHDDNWRQLMARYHLRDIIKRDTTLEIPFVPTDSPPPEPRIMPQA